MKIVGLSTKQNYNVNKKLNILYYNTSIAEKAITLAQVTPEKPNVIIIHIFSPVQV